jgi:crotonobetainyl-CoA:carnitine CoA-transferase CaiB-like acyl-CoA transferase
MAGPFCGQVLADMGADVVKVEPPEGGDQSRHSLGFTMTGDDTAAFMAVNRNKRSVALDLKDDAQRQVFLQLVRTADVLVENYRPGVADRLGVGWEALEAVNPRLIYASVSGFGQTGPYAMRPGFDLIAQGLAGVMSVTGEPGGAPVKCGVPIADFTAGLYAAFSIAAMIARVRNGGPGGHIDVPMFGTTLAIAALQTSEYFGTGRNPRKLGSAHPRNAPYQAFKARDDWFVIAAGNNRLWAAVCDVAGVPELLDDERFLTPTLRASNQLALKELLERRFAAADAADWLARFEAAGVPNAPINGYAEALSDPQAQHLQLVREVSLPSGRRTRTVVCPVWIDGAPVAVDASYPLLGDAAGVRAGD